MDVPEPLKTFRTLRPPIDVDGPRVRLGVLWMTIAFAATAIGAAASAVVFAAVAFAAASQACAAWRRRARRPYRPVAIAGAVLVTLAALGGPVAVAAAAIVTGVGSLGASRVRIAGRDWDAALTAAIALVAGVAAVSVPLARAELGASAALALLVTIAAAEASAFIAGSGARTRADGVIAAFVAIGAVSLGIAAVLVPPFRGASPWVLGAVTAVLFPLGPRLASAVLPAARAHVPALRRLDGFAVAGPVWVLVAAAILDVR